MEKYYKEHLWALRGQNTFLFKAKFFLHNGLNCSISFSKDGPNGTFGEKKVYYFIFSYYISLDDIEPHKTLTDFLDQSQFNLIVKTGGSCGENQFAVDVNLQNREVKEDM